MHRSSSSSVARAPALMTVAVRHTFLTLAVAASLVALPHDAAAAKPTRAAANPASSETAAEHIPIADVPSWIIPATPEAPSPAAPHGNGGSERGGLIDVLVDDQIRLGANVEHYVHRIERITSPAGVDEAGQLEIEYDPAYERASLHRLRLIRGGESIDALKEATIRIVSAEKDSDQRIYTGTRTAHLLVHDLRVGDVVDFDYSIESQNPVLGGRFATKLHLAGGHAVEQRRIRLLAPTSRTLAFRISGAAGGPLVRHLESVKGSTRELTWEGRDVPDAIFERNSPEWYMPIATLTISEFASWGDVAAWAVPLFDDALQPDPEIARAADEIGQKYPSPAARALAALRFVQDEVRYLGIELGAHSHRPHAASSVLKQRFGDCKDKSGLLVALLRRLEIEAHPVLVHTRLGAHLVDELPSPYAFNHAIVRIRLEGKDLWVDPTRSAEHGPLGKAPIRYGRALVAAPGTAELTAIEALFPAEPTVLTREIFRLQGEEPILDVIRTFRDEEARSIRHRLSAMSRAELQKRYLNDYAGSYPTIDSSADMTVEDGADEDRVVLYEHYVIRHFAKERGLPIRASAVLDSLSRPRSAQRSSPLGIEYPAFYRHLIEVYDDEDHPFVDPPDESAHDDALSFTVRGNVDHHATRFEFELRTHRDFVPPKDVPEHAAMIENIFAAGNYTLGGGEKPVRGGRHVLTFLSSIGALFGVAGMIVLARVAVLSLQRRRWTYRVKAPKRASGDGETAKSATAVASRADAEKIVLGSRCSCGGRFSGPLPESTWSTVIFDEAPITVARIACTKCDKARVRYFDIA